jgi:hypothetical protein
MLHCVARRGWVVEVRGQKSEVRKSRRNRLIGGAGGFPLPTSHFSLLTSHFSLLTSHFSLLTSHFSLLTSLAVSRPAAHHESPLCFSPEGAISIAGGVSPIALAFWQDAVSGGRSWDGETVLRTSEVVFRTPPSVTGRAGDVNPPVTVRARVANTAAGARKGRTGQLTSAARHTAFS